MRTIHPTLNPDASKESSPTTCVVRSTYGVSKSIQSAHAIPDLPSSILVTTSDESSTEGNQKGERRRGRRKKRVDKNKKRQIQATKEGHEVRIRLRLISKSPGARS